MSKALLIVHGIGEQRRSETTEKVVTGLRAALGDRLEIGRNADGHAVSATACGVTVEVFEVYWADLLGREANRGAFTWSTLPTLVWHPLLCRRAGLLSAGEYRWSLVLGWLALTLPASLLAFPMAQGARVFVQPFDQDRQKRLRERTKDLPVMQRARAAADAAAHGETLIEATLEGVVADVPNYMSSIVRGDGVAFDVLACFHQVMRDVRERHDEVFVLAHSLGTVVAYHALTGVGQPAGDPPYAPRRLVTIGSPLEKIRFYWPWTVRCATPSAHPGFRWTNFYHRMDMVSGSLRRFAAWAPIENVCLKSGGGILRSHVVYERSPEFLGMLTEELFGERHVPPVTWLRRTWDRAITAGENLAAPIGIVASLAMGLGAIAIVMLIVPFLVSALLRWLGAGAWAVSVGNGLSLLAVSVLVLFVVRELRQGYRSACASVAVAERRAGDPIATSRMTT